MKWTQYSSENMQEQRADVLIIPTRVEDLIQQIPDRNCVENVFTKDARLGLRRSESSEWGDEEVNVEKGNFDSGLFQHEVAACWRKTFLNGSISSPHLKKKKKRFMLFQVNWFVYGECKHAYRTWQEITSTGQKSVYYDETRPCRIDQGRTRQDMK